MPQTEVCFTKGTKNSRDQQLIALLERTLRRVVRTLEEPRKKVRLEKASNIVDRFHEERALLEDHFRS